MNRACWSLALMIVTWPAVCSISIAPPRRLRIMGTPDGRQRPSSFRCGTPSISACVMVRSLASVSGFRMGLLRSATHSSASPPCSCGCFGSTKTGPPPVLPGIGSNVSTKSPMRAHPPEKSGILSLFGLSGSARAGQVAVSNTPRNKPGFAINCRSLEPNNISNVTPFARATSICRARIALRSPSQTCCLGIAGIDETLGRGQGLFQGIIFAHQRNRCFYGVQIRRRAFKNAVLRVPNIGKHLPRVVLRFFGECHRDLEHFIAILGILDEAHRGIGAPDIFDDGIAVRRCPGRIHNVELIQTRTNFVADTERVKAGIESLEDRWLIQGSRSALAGIQADKSGI